MSLKVTCMQFDMYLALNLYVLIEDEWALTLPVSNPPLKPMSDLL